MIMKKFLTRSVLLLVLVCLAGCLGGRPPEPRRWNIQALEAGEEVAAKSPIWDVVRVARLEVAAPYDGLRLAVRRADGSLAFDSRNVFAASPSTLLRVPTRDILLRSGKCRAVTSANSPVKATVGLEIVVDTLALDCRKENECSAEVSLSVTLVEGRELVRTVKSAASVAVQKDFTASFSRAYSEALSKALDELAK